MTKYFHLKCRLTSMKGFLTEKSILVAKRSILKKNGKTNVSKEVRLTGSKPYSGEGLSRAGAKCSAKSCELALIC